MGTPSVSVILVVSGFGARCSLRCHVSVQVRDVPRLRTAIEGALKASTSFFRGMPEVD